MNANGTENTNASFIGNLNPFRYRGYYYDTDTGFYYLNSRYYDPQVKRFINADDISYLGANGDLQGFNLYAYCSNNPVMGYDPYGTWDWGKFCAIASVVAIAAIAITATILSVGAASAAIAPAAFVYFGVAANTTYVATAITAGAISVGIAAFAVADVQEIATDGESNYLDFLGDAYDEVKGSLYIASAGLTSIGEYAQAGWGKQTTGTRDAPRNGSQYGTYTKINPQGNDVTFYNGKGQAFSRYDFSHSHNGMRPHIHQFNWWRYKGVWRWNGKTGKVFPYYGE